MNAPKVTMSPLPCPFCGAAPHVQHWHGGGPEKRLIGCENEDCYTSPSVTGETLEAAIARWNCRAIPAADVANLIEASGGAERRLLHLCDTVLRGHECAFARGDWRVLRDAIARIGALS